MAGSEVRRSCLATRTSTTSPWFANGDVMDAFEIGLLWLAAQGYLSVITVEGNWVYFIAMVLVHLWRDLHFYVIHRLIPRALYPIAPGPPP